LKFHEIRKLLAFAKALDRTDPLKSFRALFHIPKVKGKPSIYFTGNSWGFFPQHRKNWSAKNWLTGAIRRGGHFRSRRPWLYYHKFSKKGLAKLTGAKPSEVVAMNQLSVNLHLMMISFYRPSGGRFKILTEAGAFPSDQYAFESQVKLHVSIRRSNH